MDSSLAVQRPTSVAPANASAGSDAFDPSKSFKEQSQLVAETDQQSKS